MNSIELSRAQKTCRQHFSQENVCGDNWEAELYELVENIVSFLYQRLPIMTARHDSSPGMTIRLHDSLVSLYRKHRHVYLSGSDVVTDIFATLK